MSSAAPDRPLVTLCAEQHRVILQLLAQLSRATDWDLGQRRTAAQRLRQRLSRHIQLERHALYPLLRSSLNGAPSLHSDPVSGTESLVNSLEHLEQQLRDLLPELTQFLHQAERSPQQLDPAAALRFHHQLRAQFEQEEQILHPLLTRCVSAEAEQQQLRLFHRRLQATLSSRASTTRHRRPSLEELERQAVTRPVLPNEKLSKTLYPLRENAVQLVNP
ncbi:hemerythrin domain-containing protein [Thermostichus vulcanus]|uniref:Hemerythrin domain-containing protein n=1 Tax=Thermostichus vulcanus str. 'Rupite' TaxID=2813851 RepID=A0ABT0CBP6_THEVL|nr:hemerythrin domain-containing protein [Thermostichus vulcanus]MCJ2543213.1 hemerythrin domain-containing protein [Thermostichus vulcanus str. 'Rupite']